MKDNKSELLRNDNIDQTQLNTLSEQMIAAFEDYKTYLLSRIQNCKGRDLEGGIQLLCLLDRVMYYSGNTEITIRPENTLGERLYQHIESLEEDSKEPAIFKAYDTIIIHKDNPPKSFFDLLRGLKEEMSTTLFLCGHKGGLWVYSYESQRGKQLDPDISEQLTNFITTLPAKYSTQNDSWKISNETEEGKALIEQITSLGCPNIYTNPEREIFNNMRFDEFSRDGNTLTRKYYEATKLQKRLIDMKNGSLSLDNLETFKKDVADKSAFFQEKTGTAGQGLFEIIFQKIATLFRGGTHSYRFIDSISKVSLNEENKQESDDGIDSQLSLSK